MPKFLRSTLHPEYIALSFGLAFVGSYCGIHLCEQFRLCSKENKPKLISKSSLMILMAISIGGIAIWSMHFVGMTTVGFDHSSSTGQQVMLSYRKDYTYTSLVVVIIMCYIGIYISSRDNFFTNDKHDVLDAHVHEIRKLSISEIQQMKTSSCRVLGRALFRNMTDILLGGIVTGAGVCVMHYLGMMAVVVDADIEWNAGIVAASVLIAIIAATAAFWILFRLLAIFPQIEMLRLASAIVATVAVNGMHYTGMSAASYIVNEGKSAQIPTSNLSDAGTLVIGAITASMIFLWIIILLVVADLRSWFYTSSETVRETDAIIKLLETETAPSHIVLAVIDKYNKIRSGFNANAVPASYFSKLVDRIKIKSGSNSAVSLPPLADILMGRGNKSSVAVYSDIENNNTNGLTLADFQQDIIRQNLANSHRDDENNTDLSRNTHIMESNIDSTGSNVVQKFIPFDDGEV